MRVFVGCSAKDSVPIEYKNLASDLSTFLAKQGHKLVFGGMDTGMMGKCYMTYKYEDAKVKAVVEVHDTELLKTLDVDTYDVTPSTFERTKLLFESSDIIIILPGGIGSLAELFSMIDEVRQKDLNKTIILFNYNNFYKTLLKLLNEFYNLGFVNKKELKLFDVVSDLNSLELYINNIEKENKER